MNICILHDGHNKIFAVRNSSIELLEKQMNKIAVTILMQEYRQFAAFIAILRHTSFL